jgi:hydrogenase maturation factor
MCVTRVARVLSIQGSNAKVQFLDTGVVDEVDVSMVQAKKDSYVEVFADQAIGRITKKEAEFKLDLRLQMNRARGVTA